MNILPGSPSLQIVPDGDALAPIAVVVLGRISEFLPIRPVRGALGDRQRTVAFASMEAGH